MDDVDKTDLKSEVMMSAALDQVANKAAKLDAEILAAVKAAPKQCDECGEWVQRLIKGVCCPCIDRMKRKNK